MSLPLRPAVSACLVLLFLPLPSVAVGGDAGAVLSVPADALAAESIDSPAAPGFSLMSGWRYRPGHARVWAAPGFDDSGWTRVDSSGVLLDGPGRRRLGWRGDGWFRLHLRVHPDFPDRGVALLFGHLGASEVYLDGELLARTGRVGSGPEGEAVRLVHDLRRLLPLRLTPGGEHVIAVRYSNHTILDMPDVGDFTGFQASLVDLEAYQALLRDFIYQRTAHQVLFVVPAAFALLHLLLFLYSRRAPGNLYYALFAGSVALLIYAPLHMSFVTTPAHFGVHLLLTKWALILTPLTGLLFLYTEFHRRLSRIFYGLAGAGVLLGLAAWAVPLEVVYYFTMLALVDTVRVVFLGLRGPVPGRLVVLVGWTTFALSCLLQVLIELELLAPPFGLSRYSFYPYVYGTLVLVVSMSVYLARAVARTNRQLAEQLEQVRALSAQALEHEREVQTARLATLNHMVAGIVHELNTPLGTMRSAVDTLSRALGRSRPQLADERLERTIERSEQVLLSAVDRIDGLLGDFRDFSHIDEAEWQIARLEEGLDSALSLLASQIEGQVTVERDYGGVAALWCAPARLNQVFLHLLTNALTAMDGGGALRLRTREADGEVTVHIADSGVGLSAEQLDNLFDVAFRRSGRVKMGMGLIADAHTVREHGGSMEVRSEPGVGTEVTIHLPRRTPG